MIGHSDYLFMVDNDALCGLCRGRLDIEGWTYTNLSGLMERVNSSPPASLHFDGAVNVDFTTFHENGFRNTRIQCAICPLRRVIRAEEAYHEHFQSSRSTKRSSRLTTSAKCHSRYDKRTEFTLLCCGEIVPEDLGTVSG
jgi:tubulin alpha